MAKTLTLNRSSGIVVIESFRHLWETKQAKKNYKFSNKIKMRVKNTYTGKQEAEIWTGKALSFLGGLAGGAGFLGVVASTALDAAGTELTDKGKGVKMTSGEFWKIAAENAGMALGGAVLGLAGKGAKDFFSTKGVGVAAKKAEAGIATKAEPGITSKLLDDGERVETPHAQEVHQGTEKETTTSSSSQPFGVAQPGIQSKIHQQMIEIHPVMADYKIQLVSKKMIYNDREVFGLTDHDTKTIYIGIKKKRLQIQQTWLHEMTHAIYDEMDHQHIEGNMSHDMEFERLHAITILRAKGKGIIKPLNFEFRYLESDAEGEGDTTLLNKYYDAARTQWERTARDTTSFDSFLGDLPWDFRVP
jgi:hypothetical protein